MSTRERSSSIKPSDAGACISDRLSALEELLSAGKSLSEGWAASVRPSFRPSAVLVPLYWEKGKLMTLFTARPAHLRRHPGQIGFPGGAFEEGDRTPADTALREAREEIGLSGDRVRLLGLLDPEVAYSSDFLVFPVVGWVSSPDALRGLEPDPCEVDRLIKVPLGIFSPEPVLEWRGEGPLKFVYPVFPLEDGDRIWGVTARILLRLIRLLHSMEVV